MIWTYRARRVTLDILLDNMRIYCFLEKIAYINTHHIIYQDLVKIYTNLNSLKMKFIKGLVMNNENSEPIQLKDEAIANYANRKITEVIVHIPQRYHIRFLQIITNLNLSGNKLTKFPLEFFNFLPNLQMLDLSNNEITNFTNGEQQNQNIQENLNINLSKNKLIYFPFDLVKIIKNEVDINKFVLQNGTFKSIEVLKLNNNELTEIDIKNLE
ncbi:extracellular matrix 2 isoform X1 [Brachionus plicatilis]|uniref:Extracellular matrix 2 isoform X1 n=1 Tax=Brachionus plicatilis TaxID=10195 RepID=A0A3M7QXA3_BRAPC|nr:extracellular matrix 2 isoform X1 [Brachionus plicatilis]